jgi:hypothetical protein
LLAQGPWFSPASSTTNTGRHDIAEILLKVALNTKIQIQIILNICVEVVNKDSDTCIMKRGMLYLTLCTFSFEINESRPSDTRYCITTLVIKEWRGIARDVLCRATLS